ncbi:hypothetical protein [Zavarzinella formosa]|uniref:hypothetical protein n=1 Tax=Zavarzinella formosa TaxID=360055 RepID=UPI0002D76171|nr:hypothetical protein [Zavarzinella formosa]
MRWKDIRMSVGLVLVCLSGCGSEKVGDVSGLVTYNGQPLAKTGGHIVFVGPQGSQIVADIGADGAYRAAGIPAGLNRVAVYYSNPEAQEQIRKFMPQKGKKPPPVTPPSPAPAPFLTPIKYASPDTSELSVQIGPGTVYNVDMTGPKMK